MHFDRLIQEGTVLRRALASALRFYGQTAWRTARITVEPPSAYDSARAAGPAIYTFWHGFAFMAPWMVPPGEPVMTMIARNPAAGIVADAAALGGFASIRASGSHRRRAIVKKGGAAGFRQALRELEAGNSLLISADVPKVARVAGKGVLQIARVSGRPVIPVTFAPRWALRFNNWDRMVVSLPFSPATLIHGSPIHIPRDADADTIEMARRQLTETLDRITLDAYERTGIAAKFKPGPGADG